MLPTHIRIIQQVENFTVGKLYWVYGPPAARFIFNDKTDSVFLFDMKHSDYKWAN